MNSRLAGFSTYSDGKIGPSSFPGKKPNAACNLLRHPTARQFQGSSLGRLDDLRSTSGLSGLKLRKSTNKNRDTQGWYPQPWISNVVVSVIGMAHHGTIAYHSYMTKDFWYFGELCMNNNLILFRKALIMSGHFHQQKIKQQLGESILLLQLLIFDGPWQVNLGPCRTIAWFTPQKNKLWKMVFLLGFPCTINRSLAVLLREKP